MSPILIPQTLFSVIVVLVGALTSCACSLYYFGHIRMDRPTIGTFNARDIIILSILIIGLPILYLALPHWALTGFLLLTFLASLSIGYRSLLPPTLLWPAIAGILGLNLWLARTQLGTVVGWQIYWVLTSLIVLLGSVAVVNLYIQGGMRLQHVAYFAFGLAFYDAFFSMVVPLTPLLADAFLGRPLDPSIGMRTAHFAANIGIGDLLIYGLFTVAAYKAYGQSAARLALATTAVFGAILPASVPLLLTAFTGHSLNLVVPAQTFFGPAALLVYLRLRRRGPERTMHHYRTSRELLEAPAAHTPAHAAVAIGTGGAYTPQVSSVPAPTMSGTETAQSQAT